MGERDKFWNPIAVAQSNIIVGDERPILDIAEASVIIGAIGGGYRGLVLSIVGW